MQPICQALHMQNRMIGVHKVAKYASVFFIEKKGISINRRNISLGCAPFYPIINKTLSKFIVNNSHKKQCNKITEITISCSLKLPYDLIRISYPKFIALCRNCYFCMLNVWVLMWWAQLKSTHFILFVKEGNMVKFLRL